MRADWKHTIEQTSTTLPFVFSFVRLLSRSSFIFLLQGGEPRGPRGDQVDLGQPIAAACPDRVPPGRVGFRVYKSSRRIACVSHFRTGLLQRELRCITPGVEGTRWRVRVRTHFLATPLGTKLWTVSSPFLLRRDRHQVAAIYKGNMNTQFPTVDANNSYDVTRSFNDYTLSASPSFFNNASNYMHRPIQSNLHASTSYDTINMHHMCSNSHASATP